MLYFASARFLVRLTASIEIASQMGGPVMATSSDGFLSTGCMTGKVFSFSVRGHWRPKFNLSAVAIGYLAILQ